MGHKEIIIGFPFTQTHLPLAEPNFLNPPFSSGLNLKSKFNIKLEPASKKKY